jgi:MFS transporter, YNFM family, putative membrane transport protein
MSLLAFVHWTHQFDDPYRGWVIVHDAALPPAPAAGTEASSPSGSLSVAMLSAGVAIFGLLYYPQPLLPSIAADLRVSASTASLAVSMTTGALALSVLVLTDLAERVGRARLMRAGLATASVATLVTVAATHMWQILLLRTIVGVALGAVVATAMGHLAAETPVERIGRVMGLYIAGTCLGGVLGRIVPGSVVDGSSWRYATAAIAAICVAAGAVFAGTLPPPGQRLTRARERPETFAAIVTGLLDKAAMRRLGVIGLVLMGVYVALFNVLAFRLGEPPFNLPTVTISALFVLSATGAASSMAAGHLADRVGRPVTLSSCILLAMVGLALMTDDRFWAVTVGLAVVTAAFFAAHAVATAWVSVVAGRYRSQGAALYLCAYYTGSAVIGPALVATYERGGWVMSVGAMALLLAVGVACTVTIDD